MQGYAGNGLSLHVEAIIAFLMLITASVVAVDGGSSRSRIRGILISIVSFVLLYLTVSQISRASRPHPPASEIERQQTIRG